MNNLGMSQRIQLLKLLRALKTVSVESLPDLVQMVPIYGPILSKALSVVISTSTACQEETEKTDIQAQIDQLRQLMEERKITDDTIRSMIQKEVMQELEKNEKRSRVYAFGLVLYPIQNISKQNEEDISEILNYEAVWEDEQVQAYADDVEEFMGKYAPDRRFSICPECLSIDFFTEYEPVIIRHEEVLVFIEQLNALLEQPFFVEYTIV